MSQMVIPKKAINSRNRWPIALVAFGVILTLVWIAVLFWIPFWAAGA